MDLANESLFDLQSLCVVLAEVTMCCISKGTENCPPAFLKKSYHLRAKFIYSKEYSIFWKIS